MQQQSGGDNGSKRHWRVAVDGSSAADAVKADAVQYRLERWMYVSDSRVNGRVYGHPSYEDGTVITTSRLIFICGNLIRTASGTYYQLGEMAQ